MFGGAKEIALWLIICTGLVEGLSSVPRTNIRGAHNCLWLQLQGVKALFWAALTSVLTHTCKLTDTPTHAHDLKRIKINIWIKTEYWVYYKKYES